MDTNKKLKIFTGLFIFFIILTSITIVWALVDYSIKIRWSGDEVLLDESGNPIAITAADRKPDYYTILVAGQDVGGGNTDTIMVVSIDMANQKYNILSIPRDTMANVPRSVKKINAAYATGGADGFKKEVSDLLGFTVDRYAIINLTTFTEIIDSLGGVEMDVPIAMNYDDPAQNLHIHLNAGVQLLNGEQAMHVVRYRKGYLDADLGRIKTQQQFLEAVLKKATNPLYALKWPGIIKKVFSNVKTDLTVDELLWMASKLKNTTPDQLSMNMLPGTTGMYNGLSYFVASNSETLALVNEKFNPYTKTIYSLNLINYQSIKATETIKTTKPIDDDIESDVPPDNVVVENNTGTDANTDGNNGTSETPSTTPTPSAAPLETTKPIPTPTTAPTQTPPPASETE